MMSYFNNAFRPRSPQQVGPANPLRRLIISTPAGGVDSSLTSHLLTAVASVGGGFRLDIRVTTTTTELALVARARSAALFEPLLYGVLPACKITSTVDDEAVFEQLPGARAVLHRGKRPDIAPLAVLTDLAPLDPLALISEAVRPLAQDEQVRIRYLVRPAPERRLQRARQELREPGPQDGWSRAIGSLFQSTPPLWRLSPQRRQALAGRLPQVRFELLGILTLVGTDTARLRERARLLKTIIESRFTPSPGAALALTPWRHALGRRSPPDDHAKASWLLATPAELACLWNLASPLVTTERSKLARIIAPDHGLILGHHRQRGQHVPAQLPIGDLQLGHAILLGKTRVGKTTLAHHLAAQVKQIIPTSSLIIIDPNGDWAVDFAARSVRPDRVRNTFLLELGDPDFPPSLPILTPPPGVSIDSFTKVTFETIKLIFRSHWSPTRMETIMFKTVAALVQLPGSTLLDVERLYTRQGFRQRVADQVRDPDLRDYWRAFDKLSRGQQAQMTEPILNRLSIFTRSAAIRNITCRPEQIFDIGGLIDEGTDLLISTAGAEIHDEADLLVEFLISRIHLAMFARLGKDGRRSPVFLAIDESQHVKGPSLPVLLSEAAKTGLCVIALSQYLDQWSPALAESILGNVGTTIVFSVGPNDSTKLAKTLRPYAAHDAEDLDRFEALVKMRVDGANLPTFKIRTLPLDHPENPQMLEQIREQSRARFAAPRPTTIKLSEAEESFEDVYED